MPPPTAHQRALCLVLTPTLWWLGLQQPGWAPVGFVAWLPLFYALHGLTTRGRFIFGYATGWLAYCLLNWWIIPTVARGSAVIDTTPPSGALLGMLGVALIGLIHGFLVALVCTALRPPENGRVAVVMALALALWWVALDWVRCQGALAHAWGLPAHTQWSNELLLRHAPWLGSYGISLLCVWTSAGLALWARGGPRGAAALPLAAVLALHAVALFLPPAGGTLPLRVLLVQTSVSSLRKTIPGASEGTYEQARRLTMRHARPGRYDLVVWPETTLEMDTGGRQEDELRRLAASLETPLLAGVLEKTPRPEGVNYNQALLLLPDGSTFRNAKRRLVPFGERAPWREFLPWLARFEPPSPLTPAPETRVFTLPRRRGSAVRIGTLICFESCFPGMARELRSKGVEAVMVLTNDEWFAGSTAPAEHAAMARLQAAESGLPVLQAANGGYTLVAAPGRYQHLPFGEPGVLEFTGRQGG